MEACRVRLPPVPCVDPALQSGGSFEREMFALSSGWVETQIGAMSCKQENVEA